MSIIVLFAIDGSAGAIKPAIQYCAIARGQFATVARPHPLFLALDGLFAAFKTCRFTSGQGAGIDPLLDTALLVGFARIDSCSRGRARRLGKSRRGNRATTRDRQDEKS
jgi:hypothetical protein